MFSKEILDDPGEDNRIFCAYFRDSQRLPQSMENLLKLLKKCLNKNQALNAFFKWEVKNNYMLSYFYGIRTWETCLLPYSGWGRF